METMDRGNYVLIRALADTAEKRGLTLTCAVDRKQFHVVKEIIDRHDRGPL